MRRGVGGKGEGRTRQRAAGTAAALCSMRAACVGSRAKPRTQLHPHPCAPPGLDNCARAVQARRWQLRRRARRTPPRRCGLPAALQLANHGSHTLLRPPHEPMCPLLHPCSTPCHPAAGTGSNGSKTCYLVVMLGGHKTLRPPFAAAGTVFAFAFTQATARPRAQRRRRREPPAPRERQLGGHRPLRDKGEGSQGILLLRMRGDHVFFCCSS